MDASQNVPARRDQGAPITRLARSSTLFPSSAWEHTFAKLCFAPHHGKPSFRKTHDRAETELGQSAPGSSTVLTCARRLPGGGRSGGRWAGRRGTAPLFEESAADKKLTEIATKEVNQAALAGKED